MLDDLGTTFPWEDRVALLRALAPLPLPSPAAALLTRPRPGGGYCHGLLRCERPAWLVPLLVQRAFLTRVPPRHLDVDGFHGTFEELQDSLRAGFRTKTRASAVNVTDDQVDRLLRRNPWYVSVRGPVADDVLTRLEQAYPSVTFIVCHERLDEPPPPRLVPLVPSLTPDEEQDLWEDNYEELELLP
jgi:hypothetical protein